MDKRTFPEPSQHPIQTGPLWGCDGGAVGTAQGPSPGRLPGGGGERSRQRTSRYVGLCVAQCAGRWHVCRCSG